ncbi:MAG TPA: ATP-binding protein [Planctomycetota bacterium]|nr:ATP-binding protein [Planctomycetota bacterium]
MPERPWSLTRRLARRFALMTSALLLLYALGSTYVIYASLRDEVHDFLEHEVSEFVVMLEKTDGSPAAMQEASDEIAQIDEPMPCAFRVLDRQGYALAEAGSDALLRARAHPDSGRGSHLPWITGTPIFVRRAPVAGLELTVEVAVDASEGQAALYKYLVSAGTTLLLFVGLAALSAWFTAWRGLRSLQDLARQARSIEGTERGATLRLHGAPVELRALVGELNAMLERIEAGLSAMKTFTAGLAHELRSPLQNLMGETEVALLAERPAKEYAQLLRSNLDDLHALSDAIDNLIAWCRSADPKQPRVALESFDFAQEAGLRLERERRTAERGRVSLRISSSGDTRLMADREGSLRVLRNLVGNAIAWSPEGAAVDVRIEGDEQGVALAVEDRGPGIPGELADRIFEPFVSGRPRKGERGGYGLGLAICRTIMLQHGGSVGFEPRSGGGTRFVARFPRPANRAA